MEFPKTRSEFREWANQRNSDIQNFNDNRSKMYGPLGKQLDLLWHDINNGAIPGRGGVFHQYIENVKSSVEKPDFDMDEYQNFDFSKEEFIEDLD